MLKVNLATTKKRKPIQIPFQMIFIVIGLAAIGLGYVFGQQIISGQEAVARQEVEDLKRKIGSKKHLFQQKEEKESDLARINEQITTLKSLSGDGLTSWYEILADLTRLVPKESVWLTNFRVDSDNRVIMSAISADKEKGEDKGLTSGIRKFYTLLQTHPRYEEVFLSQATEGTMEKQKIMRFEISCRLNKGKGGGALADE